MALVPSSTDTEGGQDGQLNQMDVIFVIKQEICELLKPLEFPEIEVLSILLFIVSPFQPYLSLC